MVQLILGRAGTGKTALLLQHLEEWLVSGKQGILLVPEQASFFNEERLTRRLGLSVAQNCQVVSFTRLARHIFRHYGGLRGVHLESTAKIALMSIVLEELSDQLEIFRRSVTQSAFVAQMCELISELMSAGVTGEELQMLAKDASDPGEQQKLRELSLLLEGYQAMLRQGYLDPKDALHRAYSRLTDDSFFGGRAVFVDGFVSFSNGEWKLLEVICQQSASLMVSLCCEEWTKGSCPTVFATAQSTARRLLALAQRLSVTVKKPLVLTVPKRFVTAGLRHFAQQYGETSPLPSKNRDGVFAFCCADAFSETETAAKQICQLVREGYRYRDIVVTARQMEEYETAVAAVFPVYGIPYFSGDKGDSASFPLLRGLTAALRSVESGFDTASLLLLAKSGLTTLDSVSAAELENYAYLWRIDGNRWKQPFTGHPSGLRERRDTPRQEKLAQKKLEHLNMLRESLMTPLLSLEKRLAQADGKAFATAIYQYLLDIDARQQLLDLCALAEEKKRKAYLDFGTQVWDQVMQVLDVFGGPLGNRQYSLTRFLGLLELCFGQIQVSLSPQTQDQILVGQADILRPNEVKVLFALGLTQDGFPAAPQKSGGLLTEAQRDRLTRDGYPLLITAAQRNQLEQFYAYFLFTQPRERLYLSYPQQRLTGEAFTPSMAIVQGEQIFGTDFVQGEGTIPSLWNVSNAGSAYRQLCRSWREDTPLALALRHYFSRQQPEVFPLLGKIAEKSPFRLDTPEGQALFAGDIRLSPSRLEQYYECPFAYFCKYGLALFPRRQVEINVLETGRLLHSVLEEMLRRYPGKKLCDVSQEELHRQSAEILRRQVEEAAGSVSALSARDRYLFARQTNTAAAVLARLGQEFAQSGYLPVAVELGVGFGKQSCPGWRLPLPCNDSVLVEGVVDRVDVFEQQDKRYLRVVDYKTGIRKFRLEDVYGGLNMQMLVYLFILEEHYGHHLDNIPNSRSVPPLSDHPKENLPGGVLYMPSRLGSVQALREESPEEVRQRRDAGMRMNGLLLDHRENLEAMEADLAGRFIPVKVRKDGSLSQSGNKPVSQQVMAQIKSHIQDQIVQMAESLKHGDIPALPVQKAGDTPDNCTVCGYCDYQDLCRREATDATRLLPNSPESDDAQDE